MHRHLRTISAGAALLFAAGLMTAPVSTADAAVVKTKTKTVTTTTKTIVRPGPGRPGPGRPGPGVRPRVVTPAVVSPRRVGPAAVRPAVAPRRVYFGRPLMLGGRPYTVVRGPRWVMWRGVRRNLVPIAALTAITVTGLTYAAYAYVPVAQPLCEGPTPEGCQLQWTEVPTPEGDAIPQCVAYCPQ